LPTVTFTSVKLPENTGLIVTLFTIPPGRTAPKKIADGPLITSMRSMFHVVINWRRNCPLRYEMRPPKPRIVTADSDRGLVSTPGTRLSASRISKADVSCMSALVTTLMASGVSAMRLPIPVAVIALVAR